MDEHDGSGGTRLAAAPPADPDEPAEARDGRRVPRLWPVLAMVVAGAALYGFYLYSQAREPIGFGIFWRPPIYGRWIPVLDPLALWTIPAGLALAAVGWLTTTSRRLPTWAALGLIVIAGVATAATISLVRGDWHDLIRGVSTEPDVSYYTSDLHFVYEYGVRGFVERHADLTTQFHSYNSKTHPAGVHVFLFLLFKIFGAGHALRITTAIAIMALSAAVAAWSMGRTMGGERAGRIAAVLFVAAPGPLMLAYTNLDMIFAVFLSAAAALFMIAARRRSMPAAGAAGAVLALGTLMTYATIFVAAAAAVAVIVQVRRVRDIAKLLGTAAVAGVAVMALARLTLGFDVLASYHSLPRSTRGYDPYWIFASPAAWLIYAGVPLAALGVVGLIRKVPGEPRQWLPVILLVLMLAWASLPPAYTKLRPGEVERTWAFLYPVLAAAAGPVVDRWTRPAGRWAGGIVAALVVISVGQAVLLQSRWDNLF